MTQNDRVITNTSIEAALLSCLPSARAVAPVRVATRGPQCQVFQALGRARTVSDVLTPTGRLYCNRYSSSRYRTIVRRPMIVAVWHLHCRCRRRVRGSTCRQALLVTKLVTVPLVAVLPVSYHRQKTTQLKTTRLQNAGLKTTRPKSRRLCLPICRT